MGVDYPRHTGFDITEPKKLISCQLNVEANGMQKWIPLQELHDQLELWLRRAQEHSEIPAAEADWRDNLLKIAQQFETCKDLVGTQTAEYLRMAVQMARTGNPASFDPVRELLQRVLADIRSGRVQ